MHNSVHHFHIDQSLPQFYIIQQFSYTGMNNSLVFFREQPPQKFKEIIKCLENQDFTTFQAFKKDFNTWEIWMYIDKYKCKKMQLVNKNNQNLIRDIMHVKFTELKYLSLNRNQIYTLDGINKLDVPLLEELFLCNNRFVRIKQLAKALFQNLWRLAIHDNTILDGENWGISENKISHFSFDTYEYKRIQRSYINWLFKFKGNNFQQIWMNSANRIQKMVKIEPILKKKYQKVHFFS